jgi:hypothetical protein
MPHPDYETLISAFKLIEPGIQICHRGGPDPDRGYAHIHGPHQAPNPTGRCDTHSITIMKENGTLSLRSPFAQQLGGHLRPAQMVNDHPEGANAGAPGRYGQFEYAFPASEILSSKWPHPAVFAHLVVTILKSNAGW